MFIGYMLKQGAAKGICRVVVNKVAGYYTCSKHSSSMFM